MFSEPSHAHDDVADPDAKFKDGKRYDNVKTLQKPVYPAEEIGTTGVLHIEAEGDEKDQEDEDDDIGIEHHAAYYVAVEYLHEGAGGAAGWTGDMQNPFAGTYREMEKIEVTQHTVQKPETGSEQVHAFFPESGPETAAGLHIIIMHTVNS